MSSFLKILAACNWSNPRDQTTRNLQFLPLQQEFLTSLKAATQEDSSKDWDALDNFIGHWRGILNQNDPKVHGLSQEAHEDFKQVIKRLLRGASIILFGTNFDLLSLAIVSKNFKNASFLLNEVGCNPNHDRSGEWWLKTLRVPALRRFFALPVVSGERALSSERF